LNPALTWNVGPLDKDFAACAETVRGQRSKPHATVSVRHNQTNILNECWGDPAGRPNKDRPEFQFNMAEASLYHLALYDEEKKQFTSI